MKTNYLSSIVTSVLSTALVALSPSNGLAQQTVNAAKLPVPSFPAIASNSLKGFQPMANGCDTVNYTKGFGPSKVWSAFIWTAGTPQSGMVHGTNSLGDKEKGNYIDLASFTTATHITGTIVWFSKAYSSNPAKTVDIKVYDNSGPSGSPGAVLGSKTLTMQEIMDDDAGSYLTVVSFPSPIAIPGNKKVFVTCDYSGLTWTGAAGTDSLGIVASDSLEENPGLVWEKTSANTWHPLDDLTTWDMRRQALFIMPFVTNNIAAPTATLAVTPANATVCTGSPINFDATGSTNTYGDGWWANPNAGYSNASINGQMLSLTYTLAGTYAVGYNSKGCGTVSTASVSVTVNPSPTVSASSNSPICTGATLQLTGTTNGTSYSWIGPNSFNSTVQSPSINPASTTHSGSYQLTVSNSNGCTATSQVVNVSVTPCTGISEVAEAGQLAIVQDENGNFFIKTGSVNGMLEINVFNLAGQTVTSLVTPAAEKIYLKTDSWQPGMYFVQLSTEGNIVTGKLLKSR